MCCDLFGMRLHRTILTACTQIQKTVLYLKWFSKIHLSIKSKTVFKLQDLMVRIMCTGLLPVICKLSNCSQLCCNKYLETEYPPAALPVAVTVADSSYSSLKKKMRILRETFRVLFFSLVLLKAAVAARLACLLSVLHCFPWTKASRLFGKYSCQMHRLNNCQWGEIHFCVDTMMILTACWCSGGHSRKFPGYGDLGYESQAAVWWPALSCPPRRLSCLKDL